MDKNNNNIKLTEEQMEIINGSLLGDGCIKGCSCKSSNKKNGLFCKNQKADNEEYIRWHFDKLKPFSNLISLEKRPKIYNLNGKVINKKLIDVSDEECSYRYNFYTCSHLEFKKLRKKWYPNDKKIIPSDLKLTPLSLAIWFCDDGCGNSKYKEIKIATQSFTFEEVDYLIELLKNIDIHARFHTVANEKRIIRISAYSYLNFIHLIEPFVVWNCFQYKIDLKNFTPSSRLSDCIVKSIKNELKLGVKNCDISKKYSIDGDIISFIGFIPNGSEDGIAHARLIVIINYNSFLL